MNPYLPPGAGAQASELDVTDAATPTLARAAGGVAMGTAAVLGLMGAQTLAAVRIRLPVLAPTPYLFVLLGVAGLYLGWMLWRGRTWAALTLLVLSGVEVLLTGAWLVLSFANGFFTLFALGAPFLTLASAALAAMSLGPCRRASAAREQLRAQGLELGL